MSWLAYPRCYKGDEWYNRAHVCGPGKDLTWVTFAHGDANVPITGWTDPGGFPLAYGSSELPQLPVEVPQSNPLDERPSFWGETSDTPNYLARFFNNLTLFLKAGNNATQAAKVAGYAAIFAVGGGLLLWYVPRKKR